MANRSLVITRHKVGSNFSYQEAGNKIEDKEHIDWFKSLAVPPAWKNVKISKSRRAKILAVGLDSAGRQQAIYNPNFRAKQEQLKFDRILRFAQALPSLRRQVHKDLRRKRLGKEKVLACIVKLIDEAYFRVGNERYAKENSSYGITTLRHKHLDIMGDTVTFDFMGKSGKENIKQVTDKQLARIVKHLDELPGYEIFRYLDPKGQLHNVNSSDVNEYIKQHMGEEFTAKDFRTWGGTLVATTELLASEYSDDKNERKKIVVNVVKGVAKRLGNTPSIARSSYIDPRVLAAYLNKNQIDELKHAMFEMHPRKYMTVDEQCLLRLLKVSNGKNITVS